MDDDVASPFGTLEEASRLVPLGYTRGQCLREEQTGSEILERPNASHCGHARFTRLDCHDGDLGWVSRCAEVVGGYKPGLYCAFEAFPEADLAGRRPS